MGNRANAAEVTTVEWAIDTAVEAVELMRRRVQSMRDRVTDET